MGGEEVWIELLHSSLLAVRHRSGTLVPPVSTSAAGLVLMRRRGRLQLCGCCWSISLSGDTGKRVLLGTARSLCSWAHHPMTVLTMGRSLSMLVACYADLRDSQDCRSFCGAGGIESQRFMMCLDHKIARMTKTGLLTQG